MFIFKLGRSLPGALRGPGLFFIVPCIDTFETIDMRTQNFIVPPQDVSRKTKEGYIEELTRFA